MPSFKKFWISFFQGAGIPEPYDEAYAKAFNQNRLRPDMLLELDKQMLGQMGVIAMGDKFAIIRHAIATNEKLRLSEIDGGIDYDPKLLEDTDDEDEESAQAATQVSNSQEPAEVPLPPVPSVASVVPTGPQASTKAKDPQSTLTTPAETPKDPTVTFVNNHTKVEFVQSNYYYEPVHGQSSATSWLQPQADNSTSSQVSWNHFVYENGGYKYDPNASTRTVSSFPHMYSTSRSGPSSPKKIKTEDSIDADKVRRYQSYSSSIVRQLEGSNANQWQQLPPPPPPPPPPPYPEPEYKRRRHSRFDKSQYPTPENNFYPARKEDSPPPDRVKRVFLFDPPTPSKRYTRVEEQNNELSGYHPPIFTDDEETKRNDQPIVMSNVGYKMLAKLGWNIGGSLGNGTGIKEPIKVEVWKGRKGLGANGFIEDCRTKKYVTFVTSTNPEERTTQSTIPVTSTTINSEQQ